MLCNLEAIKNVFFYVPVFNVLFLNLMMVFSTAVLIWIQSFRPLKGTEFEILFKYFNKKDSFGLHSNLYRVLVFEFLCGFRSSDELSLSPVSALSNHRGRSCGKLKSLLKIWRFLSIFQHAVSANITKNSAIGNIVQHLNHEY